MSPSPERTARGETRSCSPVKLIQDLSGPGIKEA